MTGAGMQKGRDKVTGFHPRFGMQLAQAPLKGTLPC